MQTTEHGVAMDTGDALGHPFQQESPPLHEFHETYHSVTFRFMKKTPNDAVTLQRHSQFTPKIKANAEPQFVATTTLP